MAQQEEYSEKEDDDMEDDEETEEEDEQDDEEEELSKTSVGAKVGQSLQDFHKNSTYQSGVGIGSVLVAIGLLAAGTYFLGIIGTIVALILSIILLVYESIVLIRPTQRGLVEYLGKYERFEKGGMVVLMPFVQRILIVNITETFVEVDRQELLTADSLSLFADMQIYFKVKPDETSVKASQYNAQNYKVMITNLAETTLRAIIGSYTLKDANVKRNKLNDDLAKELKKQTKDWGIEVVRAEIKDFKLPKDVQAALDEVVKQENLQKAAKYDAERKVNEAEGDKQSKIKMAEATKQTEILVAEGEKQAQIVESEGFKQAEINRAAGKAKAVEMISNAENKFFKGNAQLYKRLETAQKALENNSKVVVPLNSDLVNVIGDLAGVMPMKKKQDSPASSSKKA